MFLDSFVLLAAEATDPGFLASLNKRLNLGDIIVTVSFFTILMLLLKKFAWGPLMGVMDQRAELITNEIEEAEKSRIESKKLLEEQRSLLKESRNDAQAIVENAREQGESGQLHGVRGADEVVQALCGLGLGAAARGVAAHREQGESRVLVCRP